MGSALVRWTRSWIGRMVSGDIRFAFVRRVRPTPADSRPSSPTSTLQASFQYREYPITTLETPNSLDLLTRLAGLDSGNPSSHRLRISTHLPLHFSHSRILPPSPRSLLRLPTNVHLRFHPFDVVPSLRPRSSSRNISSPPPDLQLQQPDGLHRHPSLLSHSSTLRQSRCSSQTLSSFDSRPHRRTLRSSSSSPRRGDARDGRWRNWDRFRQCCLEADPSETR